MDSFTDRVYGQSRALFTLEKFVEAQRVPQSLIFYGEDGVGKFKAALEFAKLINEDTSSPHVLKQIEKHAEPYLKHVFPLPRGKNETSEDGPTEKILEAPMKQIQEEISKKILNPYYSLSIEKANDVKISSIREIKKFIFLDYSDVKYRVIIISDAHLMNESAQNALLKSLEEPPEGIIFILLTHKIDQILPTIQSRCWKIRFEPLNVGDVSAILNKYFDIDSELAKEVANFSDGSVNKALNLLDNNFKELVDSTITILRYGLAGKYHTALAEWDKYMEGKTTDNMHHILDMIIKWLDDVVKDRNNIPGYFFENHKETIERFNSRFSDIEIQGVLERINQLHSYISRNVTLNIIAMNVIFELHSIVRR